MGEESMSGIPGMGVGGGSILDDPILASLMGGASSSSSGKGAGVGVGKGGGINQNQNQTSSFLDALLGPQQPTSVVNPSTDNDEDWTSWLAGNGGDSAANDQTADAI